MKLFSELDTDQDGIIDDHAFETLYKRINFILEAQGHRFTEHERQEMNDLKHKVDPCRSNQLVLSDIIQAFMSHRVASYASSGETTQSQLDLRAREASKNGPGKVTTTDKLYFNSRDQRGASEKEAENENLTSKMKPMVQPTLI